MRRASRSTSSKDDIDILEKGGLSHFRAAMRSRDPGRFLECIRAAVYAFQDASSMIDWPSHGRQFECLAMLRFLQYWEAKTTLMKKQLLDRSWHYAKKAMRSFEERGDWAGYARTFNWQAVGLALLVPYLEDFQARSRKIKEAIEYGRKSIEALTSTSRTTGLTGALVRTALLLDQFAEYVVGVGRLKEHDREAFGYWRRAVRISRKRALRELARPPMGFVRLMDDDEALAISEQALALARKTSDTFSTGWLNDVMANRLFWKGSGSRSKSDGELFAHMSLSCAKAAAKSYGRINFTSSNGGVMWVHSPFSEYFLALSLFENEPEKKRRLVEKSLSSTGELLRLARSSGYPEILFYAHHITSKCNVELSELENGRARRRRLLGRALRHRRLAIALARSLQPNWHYTQGLGMRYLSRILADMAEMSGDPERRKKLLNEALEQKQQGLTICTAYVQSLDKLDSHALRTSIANHHMEYGDLLVRMYAVTEDEENLKKAASAYFTTANWYENTGLEQARALSYWKAAHAYEELRLHSVASECFASASRAYEAFLQAAGELKDYYGELAVYMDAWSKIENARRCHEHFEYNQAAKLYRQAANLHESTRKWKFLAPYYQAWSRLEFAEDHSRNGHSSKAIQLLEETGKQVREAKELFRSQLAFLEESEEKAMVARLIDAPTEEYCRARVFLEQARLSESTGDHAASREKFRLASEKLGEVTKYMHGPERREVELLKTLSYAWQLLAQAELDNTATSLEEAANVLQRACETVVGEKAALLLNGHSEFCKGLLEARLFGKTFAREHHLEATKHLDASASHYFNAGYRIAADHALGLKLFLDALVQIDSGNKSTDLTVRAEARVSAETLLWDAADALENAQQPAKRRQVLALLDKTRKEWGEVAHLIKVVGAALHGSTSHVFPTPAQSEERPVGSDRIEGTYLEARVAKCTEHPEMSELIEFSVQLGNLGSRPFTITRINEAVPEGTEFVGLTGPLKRQGRSLLGRIHLDPGKTETIGLSLRPKNRGMLSFAPSIVYADKNGVMLQKLSEPQIVATSPIFRCLALAFASDSESRRLELEQCGWRTLMETVNSAKVPRSHLYGEARYGRESGRQLGFLINSSLVESRIFPGGRGRGGEIRKVRVAFDNPSVKRYVDGLTRVHSVAA